MLYAESSENRSDIGCLTKADSSIFPGDFDVAQLAFQAEVRDFTFF